MLARTIAALVLSFASISCQDIFPPSAPDRSGGGGMPVSSSVSTDDAPALHPTAIDDSVGDVPQFGLKLGLTRAQVYQLVGRPLNASANGSYEHWYYGQFSNIQFSDGTVTGWAEADYDREYKGFRGFPIDFGTGVAFIAPPSVATTPGTVYTPFLPGIAENGSYRGELSADTGRPKTTYVRGYFRKDGTYVQSHFRSRPRR